MVPSTMPGSLWIVRVRSWTEVSRGVSLAKIRDRARKFQKLFGIKASDIVPQSYSDLILKNS